MDELGWGYGDAVPENATGAWGARIIVNQDGHVDLVHDRQDVTGDSKVLQALTESTPLNEVLKTISELLRSGVMRTREDEPFVLFQNDEGVTVVANTKASAGYCYIAAWCTE